jgi:hypothetical protein
MITETGRDLETLLTRKQELAARCRADPALATRLHELQRWQTARLTRTYRDLHAQARFAPAVEFFLSDLYGPKDSSGRDQDVTRAWPLLKRTLPDRALSAVSRGIELEVMTSELDHAMTQALPPSTIDEASYAAAYRTTGQPEARRLQIDLVVRAGESLTRAVDHKWTGTLIKAARGPAHAAGFSGLQDFIERGYRAFRQMGDSEPLLSAIRERETALMNALFAGRDDVFAVVDRFTAP